MATPASTSPDLMRMVPGSAKSAPRLFLEPTGSHAGMLDGGWWPRSRSPARELPGLILMIDAIRGQVLRLVLATAGWDGRPGRLNVGGRLIILDYFSSQPATLLTAMCIRSRVDILVVPPATSRDAAYAAMAQAMATSNRLTRLSPV